MRFTPFPVWQQAHVVATNSKLQPRSCSSLISGSRLQSFKGNCCAVTHNIDFIFWQQKQNQNRNRHFFFSCSFYKNSGYFICGDKRKQAALYDENLVLHVHLMWRKVQSQPTQMLAAISGQNGRHVKANWDWCEPATESFYCLSTTCPPL